MVRADRRQSKWLSEYSKPLRDTRQECSLHNQYNTLFLSTTILRRLKLVSRFPSVHQVCWSTPVPHLDLHSSPDGLDRSDELTLIIILCGPNLHFTAWPTLMFYCADSPSVGPVWSLSPTYGYRMLAKYPFACVGNEPVRDQGRLVVKGKRGDGSVVILSRENGISKGSIFSLWLGTTRSWRTGVFCSLLFEWGNSLSSGVTTNYTLVISMTSPSSLRFKTSVWRTPGRVGMTNRRHTWTYSMS